MNLVEFPKREEQSSEAQINPKEDQDQTELQEEIIEIKDKPKSERPVANEEPANIFGLDFWLVLCFFIGVLILGVSIYFFVRSNELKNEVVSVLIPQPFTENNDFNYFNLPNKMKVILIKPNTNQNNTFIC